jgi:lipopolysaccharide biosynthesis glycosyltransferase
MQLALAIRSMLDTLADGYRIALYILDGGISSSNKERCEASWSGNVDSVEWIQLNEDAFAGLKVNARFTIATYYRILCAELLPNSLDRVIFTDPDVLYLKSISHVFGLDLLGNPIAAAQDAYCPYVDNRYGMPNYRRAREHVFNKPALPGIKNRSKLSSQPYFNAGFLVIDLECFRREQFGKAMLEYCHQYRENLIWADQCALNACLGSRWRKMDAAWNVTPPVFNTPNHRVSCYDRETFDRIRTDPAMLHFAGSQKPWHFGCQHPFVDHYFAALDRTEWRYWRPVPTVLEAPIKKRLSLQYRIKQWLLGA